MQCSSVQCSFKASRSETVDSVSQHHPRDGKLLHVMQDNINKVLRGQGIEYISMSALSEASLLAPPMEDLCDSTSAMNSGHFTPTGGSEGTYKGRVAR